MRKINSLVILMIGLLFAPTVQAQSNEQHIGKLELGKKKKMTFSDRDSSITVYIDTLIMKDKSSLQFIGKKDVKLVVKHAEIANSAFISGIAGQNNASNFDIAMNIKKLGSLYVIARGEDAHNGTRTHPNGNGGQVKFTYAIDGIAPQSADRKAKNYLFIDVSAGGRMINPTSDLNQIYSRIALSSPGLRGLPQGQIYSGSPGLEGKAEIVAGELSN